MTTADSRAIRSLMDRFPERDGLRRIRDAERLRVDVPGGSLSAYRLAPCEVAGLPVLYVPGWGGVIEGFIDVFSVLDERVELYYLETREKRSSALSRRASFSMARIAADVGLAAKAFGLRPGGYILVGSSFGGGVVLQALASRVVEPAYSIVFDPMARLWVPSWIIGSAVRLFPPRFIQLLRPGLRRLVLAGMKEPVQRRRAARFIDDAELWKWKRASVRIRTWDLFDIAPGIDAPVAVVNGSSDRFHDGMLYPRIAAAIAESALVQIPVPETVRERLIAIVASAVALGEHSLLAPFSSGGGSTGFLVRNPVVS